MLSERTGVKGTGKRVMAEGEYIHKRFFSRWQMGECSVYREVLMREWEMGILHSVNMDALDRNTGRGKWASTCGAEIVKFLSNSIFVFFSPSKVECK